MTKELLNKAEVAERLGGVSRNRGKVGKREADSRNPHLPQGAPI